MKNSVHGVKWKLSIDDQRFTEHEVCSEKTQKCGKYRNKRKRHKGHNRKAHI